MGVPFAAAPAGDDNHLLPSFFEIGQKLAGFMISNDRPDRNFDHTVFAAPPVAVAARAISSPSGLDQFLMAQIEQRGQLRVGFSNDVAPGTAVAAIRRAATNELLPAKAHTTLPAITGENMNPGFVNEFHG